MKLQELRSQLESHPKTIMVEDLPDEDFGHYLFWRVTFETGVDEADQMAVCVLIKDRGTVDEQAWFKGYPAYARPGTFRDRVEAAVENYQASHPELEYYEVEMVDEERQVSRITAYTYNTQNDVLRASGYLIWDVEGSLKFRKIEEA